MADWSVGTTIALIITILFCRLKTSDDTLTIKQRSTNPADDDCEFISLNFTTHLEYYVWSIIHPARIPLLTTRHYSREAKEKSLCKCILILRLLLAGTVSLNPGPIKFPCIICNKQTRRNRNSSRV